MRQDKFKREIYDQKVSCDIFAEQIEKNLIGLGVFLILFLKFYQFTNLAYCS